MSRIRAHVFVEGRVQGVFFRAETCDHAGLYNLTGWVRNCSDGRVEAVFEGEQEDIEKMVAWCHKGPDYAAVKNMEVSSEAYTGEFDSFSIIY